MMSFSGAHALAELFVRSQDLSPMMSEFELPPSLRLADFTRCTFTCVALQKLFGALAQRCVPLALILADITMLDPHWNLFFEVLPSLDRVSCLSELDWSGNRLPREAADNFVRFFFEPNSLSFVALDRVFKTARLDEFESVLARLPPTLWGISLGGSADTNFAGSFHIVLRDLAQLPGLAAIHANDQQLTDGDANATAEWIHRHRGVVEIAVDGTAISSEAALAQLYDSFTVAALKVVGRPEADVRRFGGAPKVIEKLRAALAPALPASFPAVRANYARFNAGPFDAAQYVKFYLRYPQCRCRTGGVGAAFPDFLPPSPPLRSLAQLAVANPVAALDDLHLALVAEPTAPPQWFAEGKALSAVRAPDLTRRTMSTNIRRSPMLDQADASSLATRGMVDPRAFRSVIIGKGSGSTGLVGPSVGAAPVAAVAIDEVSAVELAVVEVPEIAIEFSDEVIVIPEAGLAVAAPEFIARVTSE
jgi:hypothetical protein